MSQHVNLPPPSAPEDKKEVNTNPARQIKIVDVATGKESTGWLVRGLTIAHICFDKNEDDLIVTVTERCGEDDCECTTHK